MKRLVMILLLLGGPVFAVEPSEVLTDPVLEARARELSKGLRCPVCQNESIDESHAAVAVELRILLRERLSAGDSDVEAVEYLVSRFGEFILLEPNKSGSNLILWLAAPTIFLIALGTGWRVIRRKEPVNEDMLSEAEKAELDKIIGS